MVRKETYNRVYITFTDLQSRMKGFDVLLKSQEPFTTKKMMAGGGFPNKDKRIEVYIITEPAVNALIHEKVDFEYYGKM